MKRMLINATQEEELRMAMVDGQLLYDLNIEAPASERKKANIYKGKITRVEPSLEAAFVDYGAERHGFLPMKEISSEYYVKESKAGGKPNIKDVLKEGQDIVVQVEKEERGNKGAALTTFISLAGRFIVLKPNKDRSGGVSRRITGEDRDMARQALNEVEIPESMSVILRTAGIDRGAEELAWDLQNLLTVWEAIRNVVLERQSPFLLYRESDSVVRALRDYLTDEVGEILIDDEATYKEALEHVEQTMPNSLKKLKHYVDPVPLFTRYQIETQIESAFAHNVNLPAGGSIVIDHTEALVSIDINSARATKGSDIEATAFNTNLEAADEIGRQLRIRDLGGLIVIDFIDMGMQKHQREVENRLRDAVRQDRARVQIGKISRFGLLEMSRQRLRPSIGESAYKTCPRCTGFGTIRGTESLALAILRIIGEEARKERTSKVIAQLPVEVATYLLNEKRDWVQNLEDQNETQVVLVANSHLETPHYDVRRVRDDQLDLPENSGTSFALANGPIEPESPQAILERKGAEPAAVGTLKPTTQVPKRQPTKAKAPEKGVWGTILGFFAGDDADKEKDQKQSNQRGRNKSGNSRGRRPQQQSRRSSQGGDNRGNQRKQQPKKGPKRNQKQGPKDSEQKASDDQTQRQQQPKQNQDKNEQGDEASTEQKRTRSRRSRGGRRRRRGGEKTEQTTENQQQADASADNKSVDAAKTEQPKDDKAQSSKPRTESPKAESPKADAPEAKTPSADAQKADSPKVEAPKAETPKSEAPKSEAPKPRSRKPRSPRSDAPKSDAEKSDAPKSDAPKAESVKAETPKAETAKPASAAAAPEKLDTKSESKSADKPAARPRAPRKPKAAGPPKARTDAERAEATPQADETASHRVPTAAKAKEASAPAEKAPAAEAKPAADKPAAKLLPWE
jgi:ribonuclease E